jgi:hypothetical protein
MCFWLHVEKKNYLMMEKSGDDEPGGEDEHWDEVVEDQVVKGVHLEKRRK